MDISKIVYLFIRNNQYHNSYGNCTRGLIINNDNINIIIEDKNIHDINLDFLSDKTIIELKYILEVIYINHHQCQDNKASFCGFCLRYQNLHKFLDNYANQMYNYDDNKYYELVKKYNNLNIEHKKLLEKYNKIKQLIE